MGNYPTHIKIIINNIKPYSAEYNLGYASIQAKLNLSIILINE